MTVLLNSLVIALVGTVLTNGVAAEDYLVSRQPRIQKRAGESGNFNISVFHVNDIHAHLDEIKESGTDCTQATGCFGGYARIKSAVDERRKKANNSLFLDVGDEFQGTLFYSFYGGEKIAETMNQLDIDAFTLGNHEFDRGDEYLGKFLKNLTMPVVCGNVQSSDKNINSTVKPYHVFPKYKTAVIAVTTETIPSISNPSEDTVFPDPIASAQYWADYVKANEKDVERIIAMTHIGYDVDIELAKKTRGIHLIVGGHSHTLLGDMEDAQGKYPTIETNLDGDEVFIVTAWRYGVYLGYIDVEFDPSGKVVAYTGGPVHLTNATKPDTALDKQIKAWRGPFEEFAAVVLGESKVELDQTSCQTKECLLGDFMADAMLDNRANQSSPDAAIINAGGVRATIDAGNITRGEVLTAFPFGNAITELDVTGEELWKVFEGIVSEVSQFNGLEVTSFAQVSKGLRVTYNPDNAVGSRLINLEIGQSELKTVDFSKTYKIVTLDFIAGGGDNFFQIKTGFAGLDTQDEVLTAYIKKMSPVDIKEEGRFVKTSETTAVTSTGSNGNDNGAQSTSSFHGIGTFVAALAGFLFAMMV